MSLTAHRSRRRPRSGLAVSLHTSINARNSVSYRQAPSRVAKPHQPEHGDLQQLVPDADGVREPHRVLDPPLEEATRGRELARHRPVAGEQPADDLPEVMSSLRHARSALLCPAAWRGGAGAPNDTRIIPCERSQADRTPRSHTGRATRPGRSSALARPVGSVGFNRQPRHRRRV